MGRAGRSNTVLMELAIINCRSPYNVIIGRTEMRSLGAVGSTIHSMIKFPNNQGIVMMETSREALWECRQPERMQDSRKEVQWHQREEKMSMIREQVILRTKSSFGRGPNSGPTIHDTRHKTGIERRGVLMAKGKDDQKGSTPRVVDYMINPLEQQMEKKKPRKVQVDTHNSSLNKVCCKGKGEMVSGGSMERRGKAGESGLEDALRFLEDDKEKTGFHTEEGVYCFTHMLKELKNSAAILQRMMEEVLADQKGWNMEIYLEEIVIKSKSELDLVQDVKETLRKLKRVNIKIDPVTSSFRVKEGRFLGFMVTQEGVRSDPEKVQAIILNPTPKSPNQIQSLSLHIAAISKFIPKIAKLQYPIRKVQIRFETTEGSGWTNEAEKALQRIKRKLNKLQTLAVPKEGRETIEKGSGVGIILVNPKEKMYAYAIRLKFKASNHAIDCEALLTRLAVSISKGMKDLHVFIDLPKFWITHLPKNLNSKVEVLAGLATIKLEFLNQEVSVGIKTRLSVEETSSSKKGKATSNVPSAKPSYNWEASGSN
ncbi:hypothetical protein Tco_0086378 [Tanacetum coccineum]